MGLTYSTGVMNTQMTFQDARTFGQTPNSSEVATSGVFEAWAEMLVIPGGTFKIGRQVLKYDDNRLFSGSAWSNTGSSHDVALFKYCVNDFQGHLGFAYNKLYPQMAQIYADGGKIICVNLRHLRIKCRSVCRFTVTGFSTL